MDESQSILTSIKKLLGIQEEYDQFDTDLIMDINSVFMILNQLGVGPKDCFSIVDDNATWEDFLGTATNVNAVKTYMYMKVRLMFDPPTSSFLLSSMQELTRELECRLNYNVDPGEGG